MHMRILKIGKQISKSNITKDKTVITNVLLLSYNALEILTTQRHYHKMIANIPVKKSIAFNAM